MTAPASRWLTGGKTRIIGTSLGAPGAGELPNTAMFWPAGVTVGWPSGDLANYNRMKDMWSPKKPDLVRVYSGGSNTSNPFSATALGAGFIIDDWRQIANDGAILCITFQDGAASTWQATADALNAAGSNATKTKYLQLVNNCKAWRDNPANTALIKSIQLGVEHEPTNNAGATGPHYVAWAQAVVNFFLDNGVGYGPKPATGHGSTYVGTWYDMIEWVTVQIGYDMRTGGPGAAYYPGDGFVQWMYFDIYAWSGGYQDSGGTGFTATKGGGIAQPGDTGTLGHYTDTLKSLRDIIDNPMQWYRAGAGGSRPVNLGLGEFAISEDLDRFTATNPLGGSKVHSADKHIKGDWFTGALKYFRGEAFTVPGGHDANNNVPADPEGLLITAPIYWNSQAAQPRWFNSRPFNTNDTTGPTTTGGTSTGTDASYSYDKMYALVNDSIFSSSPVVHTPPSGVGSFALTEGGTANDITLYVTTTPGDGAIVSYAWDPGDGSGIVTHTTAATSDTLALTYGTNGLFHASVTITDANGLTAVVPISVVVQPANSPYAQAPYINPLDPVLTFRGTYNPAVDALEGYAALGGGTHDFGNAGTAQTLLDPRFNRFQRLVLNSASCALTLPTPVVGMVMKVILVQDATGSRVVTYVLPGGVTLKWAGGAAPTLTTTANSSDELEFECVSANTWRGRRYATDVR